MRIYKILGGIVKYPPKPLEIYVVRRADDDWSVEQTDREGVICYCFNEATARKIGLLIEAECKGKEFRATLAETKAWTTD